MGTVASLMGLRERVPAPLPRLAPDARSRSDWQAWAALKRAAMKQLQQAEGVEGLVSWPQHRRCVLGLAKASAQR